MKCPNCNSENDANSKFCINCGSVLASQGVTKQEVENNNIEEKNVETINTQPKVEETVPKQEEVNTQVTQNQYSVAPNSTTAQSAQKKQRRSLITIFIIGIAIVALLVVGIIILSFGGPKKLYSKAIEEGITQFFESESFDAKTAKSTASIEISSSDANYESVNGIKADANIQADLETKKMSLKVNASQNETSYLNLSLFGDLNAKKGYISESNIYDKTVSMDIDEDTINSINELLNVKSSEDTSKERKIVSKILIDTLNDNLDKSYFSKNKVTVQIDGKDKRVTDNILTLTESQLKLYINNVVNTLKENEEFMTNYEVCFGEKETLNDFFTQLISYTDYLDDEDTSENPAKVQVHYYTSGMFDSFVGVGVIALSEGGEDSIAYEIMKVAKDEYKLSYAQNYSGDEPEESSIVVKVNKLENDDIDVEIKLDEIGVPMTLKLKTTVKYNEAIDNFDTQSAVAVEDLTQEDYTQIMENLENSPLALVFNMLSNYELLDDASDYVDDFSDEDEVPSDIDLEGDIGYVVSYDDNYAIFDVPSNFEESEHSDDTYRIYNKKDGNSYAYVCVDLSYGTPSELIELCAERYDYLYDDPEFYYNIDISDVSTTKINGIEYYFLEARYDYGSTGDLSTYEKYYITNFDDNYCYLVQVTDDDNIITDSEIEEFLNMSFGR